MTQHDKERLYKAGEWVFAVPPVCTANWDDASWIKWIDACDGWRPKAVSK